jgi:hypothetical protein
MPAEAPLAADDRALIERVATRVVALGLDVPALLAIETATPLSVVAGQAMLFFEPFLGMALPVGDVRRFARLVERRDALAALAAAIESGAERKLAARRAAAAARRKARRTGDA